MGRAANRKWAARKLKGRLSKFNPHEAGIPKRQARRRMKARA